MISALIVLISTVLGSVAHGADWLSKGVILPIHAIIVAVALWVGGVSNCWLVLSIPIICIYWFLFRMGRQAKAELDMLAGIGSAWKTVEVYLIPCGITAIITAALFAYAGMWLYMPLALTPFAFLWIPPLSCKVWSFGSATWPDNEENRKIQRKQRMKVEAAVTLAPAGLAIAVMVYVIIKALEVFDA